MKRIGLVIAMAALGTSQPTQSPAASAVDRWLTDGEKLVADTDKTGLSQTARRQLALPLLVSAWQNRHGLSPERQRRAALRLAQASEGDDAWRLLQSPEVLNLFRCASSSEFAVAYDCAERDRLLSRFAYFLHSSLEDELAIQRQPVCSGLDMQGANLPGCLQLSLEHGEAAHRNFERLAEGLAANSLAAKTITERLPLIRLNLALAHQELGRPEEAQRWLDRITVKTAVVNLHQGRIYRDLGQLDKARPLLQEVAKAANSEIAWLAEVALGTLDIREGHPELASDRWIKAFEKREATLNTKLREGGVLGIESRLRESENSDDIVLSACLKYSGPEWDALLTRYIAAVLGAGDRHLSRQYALWRSPAKQELFAQMARTVTTQAARWNQTGQIAEERLHAFADLSKLLAKELNTKGLVAPEAIPGKLLWDETRAALERQDAELLAVLQHRPFDFQAKVADATGPSVYTAVIWQPGGRLIRRTLGNVTDLDMIVRSLRGNIDKAAVREGHLEDLNDRFGLPPRQKVDARRLFVLASGEFQHFPWVLLSDSKRMPVLDRSSVVLVQDVTDISAPEQPKRTGANYFFGPPDVAGAQPALSGNWPPLSTPNAERIRKEMPRPLEVRESSRASERELLEAVNAKIIQIYTHAGMLENSHTLVTAADRAFMLLSASAGHDEIFLSSEARYLRLDGTALAGIVACGSGFGTAQRREPPEGFRRAFHIAGARTVLAPLWLVHSDPATTLIASFYKNAHLPPDMALRRAQIQHRGLPVREWAGWAVSGLAGPLK